MAQREPIHLETSKKWHDKTGMTAIALIALLLLLGGAGYWYEYKRLSPRGEAPIQPAVSAQKAEPTTNTQEDPEAQEPVTTLTEVSPGVFYLDFGGANCDTAKCLKRASELVLGQPRATRILSVAAIGVYGSPTALIIVTGHTYE